MRALGSRRGDGAHFLLGRHRKAGFTAVSLGVALSLTAAACGSGGSTSSSGGGGGSSASAPGVTSSSILFGQTVPHSGPAGQYGQSTAGVVAYFDMINAKGGVNGRKLQLKSLDDNYTPTTALQATKQLVDQDHVFAEVAINGSATTQADLTVTEPANVPVIGPQTGAQFLQPFVKSVYNVWPAYTVEGKALGDFAVNNLHLSKIAVLYQNDDFGKSLLAGVQQSAANAKTVASISYDPTQTDFSTDALKAQHAGADGVLFLAVPGSTTSMLNAMAAIHYNPAKIISQVGAIPSTIKTSPVEFPGSYIGAFVPPLSPPGNALAQQFVQAMAKYQPGAPVNVFSGWGWIEAQVAVAGLQNVKGALTRNSYEQGLDSVTNLQTMGGPLSYTSSNHHGLQCEFMVQADSSGNFVDVPSGPKC